MVTAAHIEQSMLRLLAARKPESSICPSEVARELWPAQEWREHMDDVRAVAAHLVANARLRITQGDNDVNIEDVKGPIRIRRGSSWQEP